MAEILPFIGTRYNSQLIGNLSKVIAPPYDVISPEMQDELHARHPNNVIRLELARSQGGDDGFSNKYTRSANAFRTWRSDGILIEDEKPSIYLYEQEFKSPDGSVKKRRGYFAMVKLEEYKSGKIRAHEETFSSPKSDRLQLMRATHANFSPIFVIYKDPKNEVHEFISSKMTEKPWEEATDDDGVVHRLWVVQKKDFINNLREMMKDRQLYIADGHHRFETALSYRDEMREETGKSDGKQPFDYMMMYLTNAEQDGLVILPTHRALSRRFMSEINIKEAMEELRENFDVVEAKVNLEKPDEEAAKVQAKVQELGKKRPSFAMVCCDGKVTYLSLKPDVDPMDLIDDEDVHDEAKKLDTSLLHYYLINQVFVGNPEYELEEDECIYVRDLQRLFTLIKTKKAYIGFVMNATPIEQVIRIVSAGIKMPHKTTHFFPKIISGFVIRNLDCEVKKSNKR